MSEFRIEKRRAEAELTLSTGTHARGAFFLAGSTARHHGPERVSDLLNGQSGFFPFELAGTGHARTVLYNRAHVAMVALPAGASEAQLEPGYDLAKRMRVAILLTTGVRVTGTVSIYLPAGHDRLSDYAHDADVFEYLETADHTLLINTAHVVELVEAAE